MRALFRLVNMLSFDFSIFEKKDGEVIFKKTVEFYGGAINPDFRGGEYVTSDPYEIRLLQEHPDFNKVFVMEYLVGGEPAKTIKEVSKPIIEADNKEEVQKEISTGTSEAKEEKVKEPKSVTAIDTVKSLAEGILFLKDQDAAIKVGALRNKNALKEKALEMGFEFPNLK